MVAHMATVTRTLPRVNDIQLGDKITIQDGKGQQLTGVVHVYLNEMVIQAFGQKVVFAKWVPSRVDPGDGVWKGTYKLVDWEAPIPGL